MLLITVQLCILLGGILQAALRRSNPVHAWLSMAGYTIYVFITGARWRTGTDWLPYEHAFSVLKSNSPEALGGSFEPGFAIFMELFSKTFGVYPLFLFVASVCIAFLLYWSARLAKLPPLLFIAFLFMAQSQFWYPVRQQLAIAVCIFSVSFAFSESKHSLLRYCAPIVGASLVHSSSLITLSIIAKAKSLSKARLFAMLGLFIVLCAIAAPFMAGFFESRITSYIYENAYEFESSRSIFRLIERLFTGGLLLYLLTRHGLHEFDVRMMSTIRFCLLAGLAISAFALLSFPYLARLASYFNWIEALIASSAVLHARRASSFTRLVTALVIVVFAFKYVGSLASYWDLLDPYYFFFESVDRSMY